jgi:uridine kinase
MARFDMAQLVFDGERGFDRQVDRVARQLFEVPELRVAMIAGPSSSGKTTFCNLLAEKLEQLGVSAHRVSLDDFFIDRERVPLLPSGLRDFDSPAALDLATLGGVINGIMNDEWVELPRYDFITGKSCPRAQLMRLHPEDIVLIEGIHALNPLLTEGQDKRRICRIGIKPRRSYIMPSGNVLSPDELRLIRRTIRDYYTRGHSLEATLKQWGEVCSAEEKYITPFINKADYDIDSGFHYELFVYKHCLKNLMDDCTLPAFANIKAIMQEVRDVPFIQIPQTSLLNEFAIIE